MRFRGVKKSSREDQYVEGCASIENTTDNKRAADSGFGLVAGTAWLFARPELDQRLDYLFVDEAGQVSLAKPPTCSRCWPPPGPTAQEMEPMRLLVSVCPSTQTM